MISPTGDVRIRVDTNGSGMFGASRENHRHAGLDLEATPGQEIVAPMGGLIKIGYPYDDDTELKIVNIVTGRTRARLFYVEPLPHLTDGKPVCAGDCIGVAQDLTGWYLKHKNIKGMTNHIHFEVRFQHGYWSVIGQELAIDPLIALQI